MTPWPKHGPRNGASYWHNTVALLLALAAHGAALAWLLGHPTALQATHPGSASTGAMQMVFAHVLAPPVSAPMPPQRPAWRRHVAPARVSPAQAAPAVEPMRTQTLTAADAQPAGSAPQQAAAAAESFQADTVVADAPPAPSVTAVADADAARPDHERCAPADYPRLLRERGVQGTVWLRVHVEADGSAGEVRVSQGSGWRLFDEAAARSVQACRFVPARRGSERQASWVEFPVRFVLAG